MPIPNRPSTAFQDAFSWDSTKFEKGTVIRPQAGFDLVAGNTLRLPSNAFTFYLEIGTFLHASNNLTTWTSMKDNASAIDYPLIRSPLSAWEGVRQAQRNFWTVSTEIPASFVLLVQSIFFDTGNDKWYARGEIAPSTFELKSAPDTLDELTYSLIRTSSLSSNQLEPEQISIYRAASGRLIYHENVGSNNQVGYTNNDTTFFTVNLPQTNVDAVYLIDETSANKILLFCTRNESGFPLYVFQSTNDAVTWTQNSRNTGGKSLSAIKAPTSDAFMYYRQSGGNYEIRRTTDDGSTFSTAYSTSNQISGQFIKDSSKIYIIEIIGTDVHILQSTDNGANWTTFDSTLNVVGSTFRLFKP